MHENLLISHAENIKRNTEATQENTEAIAQLGTRTSQLEVKVDRLEVKVDQLDERVHGFGLIFEEHQSKLDAILEIVTHINKRYQQQD